MHPGAAQSENIPRLVQGGDFGWVAALASEMGDTETLQGLLAYADKNLAPRIQNGGLTYARSDTFFDEKGNYALSPPMQANALLPLARLNVANGFQRLYARPWSPKKCQHYKGPALTEVDFSVDVYRALYVAEKNTLLFDLAVYEADKRGHLVISRAFGRGDWTLKRNGAYLLGAIARSWRALRLPRKCSKMARRCDLPFGKRRSRPMFGMVGVTLCWFV